VNSAALRQAPSLLAQLRQVPVQLLLQHRPSTHWPVVHSQASPQVLPWDFFAWQVLPMHAESDLHWFEEQPPEQLV
jgi:hypothetical protein